MYKHGPKWTVIIREEGCTDSKFYLIPYSRKFDGGNIDGFET